MNNFIDIMNRLKLSLSISSDNEVASLLGISQSAFAGRKKRNSFPSEQLRLVALKHPELNLDVEYILNGTRAVEKGQASTELVDVNFNLQLTQGEIKALSKVLAKCISTDTEN